MGVAVMGKNFYERYGFTRGGIIFSAVIIVISFVGFVFSSARLNVVEASTTPPSNMNGIVAYEVIKDASIVFFSTFGVNLLLGICIEKKSTNKAVEEFFSDEFLQSKNFNDMVPFEKQRQIYEKYKNKVVFNNMAPVSEMSNYLQERLCKSLCDYYYEKCDYDTTCVVDKGMLKKVFTKDVKISFLKENPDCEQFEFFSMYTKKINGKEHLKITRVRLKDENGGERRVLKKASDYRVDKTNRIDETLKVKNGYDSYCRCFLEPHVINEIIRDNLSLEINWYCYEMLDDCLCSVYRVKVPCKKFTLDFRAPEDFKVLPNAFGFIDRSQGATNSTEHNVAKIEFAGWIFPDDGAIINLLKNP